MNASAQDLQREAQTLAQAVTAAYAETPLMEVGTRLKELIEGVAAAAARGSDASLVQALATVRGCPISVATLSNLTRARWGDMPQQRGAAAWSPFSPPKARAVPGSG